MKPLVILKIVPEAGYETRTRENRPIAEKQRHKLTNGRGEKLDRYSEAVARTIFKICKCFQRSKQKFSFIFLGINGTANFYRRESAAETFL
jgi:hypothetical protein